MITAGLRLKNIGYLVASLTFLFLTWEVAVRTAHLNPVVFPPSSAVVAAAAKLLTPRGGQWPVLLTDILTSLTRLGAGVALGMVAGVTVGLIGGMSRYAYRIVSLLVNTLIPIPPYAWIPILMLWLGSGDVTIVLATTLSASLPLVYNTMTGVRGIDRRQVWALQTFGAGLVSTVRWVVLPAALASILSGLRLSIGQAWRTLVGGEFIAAPTAGIGFLIFNARQFLAIDVMFVGILTLGILGFLLVYWLVGLVEERTVVRWGILARR